MRFFVHSNFIPAAVELLGLVYWQTAEFELFPYPEDTPPDDWLIVVGKQRPRPVILSADNDVLRNSVTRRALRDSGCTFVCFEDRWSKIPWDEYAWRLIKAWPDIQTRAGLASQQAIIRVSINGKCRLEKP